MHDLRHDPTTGNVLNNMPRHDPEESDDRWLRPYIADLAARQFERVNMPDERTRYDLHAPAALHPLTDIETLRAEVDALAETLRLKVGPVDVALDVDYLREKLDYLAARVDALEARQAMLVSAIDRHADALQVLVLRGTP